MKSKIYLISVILFLIFCLGNSYGSEIIGTDSSGIRYRDVAESSWTQMETSVTDGDIAAGDFTGDGIADVASVWPGGLWYQDGDTLDWIKLPGSAPNSVTAGDMTGDGRAEIIGTWSSGIWYRDVAESSWIQMTTKVTDGDIAAGDFTGDGIADVASVWPGGLWYQDGDTLDWTKVGTAPDKITAGDVTGDGRAEIIGTWSSGIWYRDVAESSWTQMETKVTDGDIAAGDFTGDGKADVASIWASGLWYQDGDTLDWTKIPDGTLHRVTAGDVTGPPLWPLQVGDQFIFEKYDNLSNQWDFTQQIVEQDTFEGKNYFKITKTNQNNEGWIVDAGYFRSTSTEIYRYNSTGPDYLEYQKAPVGTKWSFYEERPSGFNYKVIEIVAIETITVPYGEFQDAYKHRRFRAVDPDDLSQGKSPDWYDWIVPDVAMWVMEEDYWVNNPPEWSKLTDIQVIPRPKALP